MWIEQWSFVAVLLTVGCSTAPHHESGASSDIDVVLDQRELRAQLAREVRKSEEFLLVVLPDSQELVQNDPEIFEAQVRWIVEQRRRQNIAFVTHVGDVVNTDNLEQWRAANAALSLLDDQVAYGISVGNHDMQCADGDPSLFTSVFPQVRYHDEPWYVAGMDNNVASAQRFRAAGLNFLVVHLPCNAPDPYLEWANRLIRENADHRVIVTTHMYLGRYANSTDERVGRMLWSKCYGTAGNTPEQIWEKSLKHHPNLTLVLSGDQSGIQAARQTSRGVHGNFVHELMSDYKTALGSESGYLRLLRFYARRDLIEVSTYSPHLDLFAVSTRLVPKPDQHTFKLSVPLSESKSWEGRKHLESGPVGDTSDS